MHFTITSLRDNLCLVQWDITWMMALEKMKGKDIHFMSLFIDSFHRTKFKTFFWECSPVSASNAQSDAFVYVILRTSIPLTQDFTAFQEHHPPTSRREIISFDSKSGGTILVVPTPSYQRNQRQMSSLGPYLRDPQNTPIRLFQHVAKIILHTLATTKNMIWLNTHGLGVPWLHIRIDFFPKYNSFYINH